MNYYRSLRELVLEYLHEMDGQAQHTSQICNGIQFQTSMAPDAIYIEVERMVEKGYLLVHTVADTSLPGYTISDFGWIAFTGYRLKYMMDVLRVLYKSDELLSEDVVFELVHQRIGRPKGVIRTVDAEGCIQRKWMKRADAGRFCITQRGKIMYLWYELKQIVRTS